MRNVNVETISFTDITGKTYAVKDMREYPEYNTLFILNDIRQGDYIDEIATRQDVYREDREDLSYMLFEANIREIVEANWDLRKIRSLKIPALRST